jgi:hypothetical protein
MDGCMIDQTQESNTPQEGRAGIDLAGGLESTNQKVHQKNTTNPDILKNRSTSSEVQRDKLIALLRIGPQTTYSLRKHGLAQCAARIFGLRKEGFTIITEKVAAIDSDGFAHGGVARYSLIAEPAAGE